MAVPRGYNAKPETVGAVAPVPMKSNAWLPPTVASASMVILHADPGTFSEEPRDLLAVGFVSLATEHLERHCLSPR
jgi:hypothetical protein